MGYDTGDKKLDSRYSIGKHKEKQKKIYTKPNRPLAQNKSSNWEVRYNKGTNPLLGMTYDKLSERLGPFIKKLTILLRVVEPHIISFEFKKLQNNVLNSSKEGMDVKEVLFIGYGPSLTSNFLGLPVYSWGGDFTPISTFSPFSFEDIHLSAGTISWFEINFYFGYSRTRMKIFSTSELFVDSNMQGLIDRKKPPRDDNMKKNPNIYQPNQKGLGLEITHATGIWVVVDPFTVISSKKTLEFTDLKNYDPNYGTIQERKSEEFFNKKYPNQ